MTLKLLFLSNYYSATWFFFHQNIYIFIEYCQLFPISLMDLTSNPYIVLTQMITQWLKN